MARVMNEEVRRRAGIKRELVSRADLSVLSWFGHVESVDSEVSGVQVRGRPRVGWMV